MKGVLRVTLLLFTALPVQRWLDYRWLPTP